jgi:hypothetical protein
MAERTQTIIVPPGTNATLQIASFETAKLVSYTGDRDGSLSITKDGVTEEVSGSYLAGYVAEVAGTSSGRVYVPPRPIVVAGPAALTYTPGINSSTAMLTFTITPELTSPDRTIIIPPTTNKVQIVFETSTNLLHWSTGTSGIYGSPDEARFFRINLIQLP